jgi:hypothetical protein
MLKAAFGRGRLRAARFARRARRPTAGPPARPARPRSGQLASARRDQPERTAGIEGGVCGEVRRRCRCLSAAASSAVANDSYGRGQVLARRDHPERPGRRDREGAQAGQRPRQMRPICDHDRQESSHDGARRRRGAPRGAGVRGRRFTCIPPVSAAPRTFPPNAPERIRTSDLRFRRPTLYPAELRALVVRPGSVALVGRLTGAGASAKWPWRPSRRPRNACTGRTKRRIGAGMVVIANSSW